MVVTNFSFQCLSKITRKSFENIERLQQIYFETLSEYANQIIIISIMAFYPSVSLRKDLKAKKLSEGQAGRNSLRLNNMCCRLRRIGDRHATFKLFSYLNFLVCFACYPPESFKIICLTCIWLKFVDTSFHSSQKKSQIHRTSLRHFLRF